MSKKSLPMIGTYGAKPDRSIPLFDSVRSSDAYQVLTSLQRCVLNDYFRAYYGASGWDTRPIPGGLIYTFAQCMEPISRTHFFTAVNRLIEVGFLSCPPEIQEARALAPRRFRPSEEWKKYEPTTAEAAKMRKQRSSKGRALEKERTRRARFRAGLGTKKTKRRPQKEQDTSPQKEQDITLDEPPSSPQKEQDITLDEPPSSPQKEQDITPKIAPFESTKSEGLTTAMSTTFLRGGELAVLTVKTHVGPQVDASWLGGLVLMLKPSPLAMSTEVRKLAKYERDNAAVSASRN